MEEVEEEEKEGEVVMDLMLVESILDPGRFLMRSK